MGFAPIINQLLGALWWLIPLAVMGAIIKSPWFKGVMGELFVNVAARLRLPKEVYIPLHDITLPTPDGTTQIDHVFVSRYGIFVVETKNMKGWIFGGEHQAQWTQQLFKASVKFQNPLRQNYKHVKAIEALLGIEPGRVHSVIAFVGDSTFKTQMPANVKEGGGYISYIKTFQQLVFTPEEVQQLVTSLKEGRLAQGWKTHREHVKHLKERANPDAQRLCAKCGSAMVLRKVAKGDNAGKPFWGCSGFPKCRFRQDLG